MWIISPTSRARNQSGRRIVRALLARRLWRIAIGSPAGPFSWAVFAIWRWPPFRLACIFSMSTGRSQWAGRLTSFTFTRPFSLPDSPPPRSISTRSSSRQAGSASSVGVHHAGRGPPSGLVAPIFRSACAAPSASLRAGSQGQRFSSRCRAAGPQRATNITTEARGRREKPC
jgi:hypothetical protein